MSRGGYREGAGRKSRIGKQLVTKRSITLPPEWWDYALAEHVGNGNASAGVLAALKQHANQTGKKRKAKTG